jgi:hypothetical protein
LQKINPEWQQKVIHRQKYIDYIRSFQNNTPKKKISSLESIIDVIAIKDNELKRTSQPDQENGLLPPEPIENMHLESVQLKFIKRENQKDENRKYLASLIQKISEPGLLQICKPFHSAYLPLDWEKELLTKSDLANIYLSQSMVDFGETSIHADNTIPLNFLNAIDLKKPICVSLAISDECKNSGYRVTISPECILLAHYGMGGFEVTIQSDQEMNIEGIFNYIINKRYILQVPFRAQIVPVNLKPSTEKITIQIKNAGPLPSVEGPRGTMVRKSSIINSLNGTKIYQYLGIDYHLPFATKSLSLANEGRSDAWYLITDQENSLNEPIAKTLFSPFEQEGHFEVLNSSGRVPANSTITVSFTYVPGIKISCSKQYFLKVLEHWNSEIKLIKTIPITVYGEGVVSECELAKTSKQGFALDFGPLPIICPDDDLDMYSNSFTPFSKAFTSKYPIIGTKIIRIKNNGTNPCNFVASAAERIAEIEISPTYGVIREGQTVELCVSIMAMEKGIFNDHVIINLLGGGKCFRVPIKYEGCIPNVEFSRKGMLPQKEVIIGSSSVDTHQIWNKSNVMARVVFDLNEHPNVFIRCREEKLRGVSAFSRSDTRSLNSSASSTRSINDKPLNRIGVSPNNGLLCLI